MKPPLIRALVVEDDRFNVKLLGEIARASGWQVEFATDGVEALAAIDRQAPDLVLLDLMIPRLDGFGVLERIRGNPGTAEIAVVVVSAIQDPEARARAVELGADDFAPKPFRMLDLQMRARAALDMRAFRRRMVGDITPPQGRPRPRALLEEGAQVDAALHSARARGLVVQVVTMELSEAPDEGSAPYVDALLTAVRDDALGVFFRGDHRLSFVWSLDALATRRRVASLHAEMAAARAAAGRTTPRLWWGVGADRDMADAGSASAKAQDLEPIAT